MTDNPQFNERVRDATQMLFLGVTAAAVREKHGAIVLVEAARVTSMQRVTMDDGTTALLDPLSVEGLATAHRPIFTARMDPDAAQCLRNEAQRVQLARGKSRSPWKRWKPPASRNGAADAIRERAAMGRKGGLMRIKATRGKKTP